MPFKFTLNDTITLTSILSLPLLYLSGKLVLQLVTFNLLLPPAVS